MDSITNKTINIVSIDIVKNKSNCKDFEVLYLKCMKRNDPLHTKCKLEFEQWYHCFTMFKY